MRDTEKRHGIGEVQVVGGCHVRSLFVASVVVFIVPILFAVSIHSNVVASGAACGVDIVEKPIHCIPTIVAVVVFSIHDQIDKSSPSSRCADE